MRLRFPAFRLPSFRWLALPLCALVLAFAFHVSFGTAEAHCLPLAPGLVQCLYAEPPYASAVVATPQGVYQYDYYPEGVVAHLVTPAFLPPFVW